MRSDFGGTGVALATPLTKEYEVDFEGLNRLVEHTISGNVDYLVVMGTTGESPVFSWSEKLAILDFIIGINDGRKPIVFGLGGNYTQDLIVKSKDLSSRAIDAILSVGPYYNRPSQKGIIRHFEMIADASPLPVILYNVPARTACNMTADTTLKLASHSNIIAMKEASGNMDQINQIIGNKPDGFQVLSGEDRMTLEMIENGANGVISVIGNILPSYFTAMVNAAIANDSTAGQKDYELKKAYELLSKEGNPSSLKAGLSVLGICDDTVKPPLYEGSEGLKVAWKSYLENLEQ